jgi:thiamine pyrophosphate-dependent acetolactate synthase large subunit-like protein
LDPVRIGLRYPVEVGLVGDCRRTLQKLLPLLKNNRKRSFPEEAQAGMKTNNSPAFDFGQPVSPEDTNGASRALPKGLTNRGGGPPNAS